MTMIPGVYVFIWNPRIGKLLLLHRKLHWSGWECVKGHQEASESDETTARREVQEETGLTSVTLMPLPSKMTYESHHEKFHFSTFLAITDREDVTTSFEHDDARWVSYDDAMRLLTWPNSRDLLLSIREKLTNNV